jgi:hypothetical protein
MAPSSTQQAESVQEGSRWLHNPPDGPTFAAWFKANVKLHEGLKHEDYVNGITLIPNKETIRVTRDGEIVEVERLVFSPYPQVETRVAYFWDWCRKNHYLGEIEILPAPHQSPTLPEGIVATVVKSGSQSHTWLGAKCRVRAFERDARSGDKGRLVLSPPKATKTVPLHTRYGPDVNAPLKAETGAIGRALGFAGMLVIPGAGISTAEDMLDLATVESAPGPEPAAALPAHEPETAEAQDPAALHKLVEEHIAELQKHPKEWTEFIAWASERGLPLENTPPAALRPLEAQLRRKLEQIAAKGGEQPADA